MRYDEVASELRWMFHDARGELGLHSNFNAIVARIEGGGPSSDAHPVDMRRIDAATRARRICRTLYALDRQDLAVLCAAFAMESEHRLLWVMRLDPEAAEEHRKSRSTRELVDWLYRLHAAARQGRDYERRSVFAKLHSTAERSLRKALDAYAQQQRREREQDLEGGLFRRGAS